MEHFYNEHHIRVSVSEAFPGWVANLFISYREGVESRQAIEAGLATAKHWIDTGKP
jgi:hypothetical protein